MTEIIEVNFSKIKDMLKQNKEEIINAVTTDKNNHISKLEGELKDLINEARNA